MNIPDVVKLLLVEGSEETTNTIKDVLNKMSYTSFDVHHVKTLKEAKDFYKNNKDSKIDIVLLDLILPNSQGLDTFKQLYKCCGDVPIVIISPHDDIGCQAVRAGAQDFIPPPDLLTPGLLVRSIKYAVERKKLETSVKSIVETSSLGYLIYRLKNDDLIFSGYNPAASKILGVDCSMYVGKKIYEAFPNLPSKVIKNFTICAKDGIPYEDQIIEYEDENIPPAFYRFNAYRTEKKSIAVTFEDVSDKINLQRELEGTRERYREIVESTNAAIYEIDFKTDRITYANDVLCKLTGYSKEEIKSMPASGLLTEKSAEVWIDRFNKMVSGEEIPNSVEYEVKIKDGSTR